MAILHIGTIKLQKKIGQYKMMQNTKKILKPWHIGTYLRVLNESYPMNTTMTGFSFFKSLCIAFLCFG